MTKMYSDVLKGMAQAVIDAEADFELTDTQLRAIHANAEALDEEEVSHEEVLGSVVGVEVDNIIGVPIVVAAKATWNWIKSWF